MKERSAWRILPLLLLVCGLLFNQAGAAWIRMADVSGQPSGKPVKGGGSITTIRDTIYLVVGNNTLDVMKYSIGGNSWTALTPGMPQGDKQKRAKKGAYIVDDREKVYAFKGGGTNEFYSYDPATGAWSPSISPAFTKGVKGGFATYAKMDATKYIYAGSGSKTSEWKRFNIATGAWETASPLALPVAKVKIGSSLAFADGKMYFLRSGGKETNFYVADLEAATPVWTAMKALPLTSPAGKGKKVKEGGCLQFHDNVLYAVKGGNTKQFWSYDPLTDVWAYVGEVGDGAATKGIKCGKSLTDGGDGIFCIIGNNTNEFWHYTPPVLKSVAPGPSTAGGASPLAGMTLRATPNPAPGSTTIRCSLPTAAPARLSVFNALGELAYSATSGTGSFGAVRLPAGVYVMRVAAGGSSVVSSLIVLK
jgi:hypothetical protein